jgi:hypothetical protein
MASDQYKQFNCYLILNVSPTATPAEIKAAMRRESLKSHPDVGGSHAAQAKINVAYEILSDPIQRQAHDIYWQVAKARTSSSSQSQHTSERAERRNTRSDDPRDSTSPPPFAAFKRRLDAAIQSKKGAVWGEFETIKKGRQNRLTQEFERESRIFYFAAAGAVVSGLLGVNFPLLWIASAIAAYIALNRLSGITIGSQSLALFGSDTTQQIERVAHELAAKDCHNRAAAFDRHISDLAAIVELVGRPSSFDDSETQVARRLTAALFLSGYNASRYDGENRTILFSDGDERILVRYRHRSGAAVNVAYVEKLCQLMSYNRSASGILFCSPGLSGNAAKLAERNRIKWYSLADMNEWIDEILASDRSGPSGDVLKNLDDLRAFLSSIAPRVSQWRRRGRRY